MSASKAFVVGPGGFIARFEPHSPKERCEYREGDTVVLDAAEARQYAAIVKPVPAPVAYSRTVPPQQHLFAQRKKLSAKATEPEA